jgi:hypothetical protein
MSFLPAMLTAASLRYVDALNSHKAQLLGRRAFNFKTKLNSLAHSGYEFVQRASLGVATVKRWNGSHVEAISVSFNYNPLGRNDDL